MKVKTSSFLTQTIWTETVSGIPSTFQSIPHIFKNASVEILESMSALMPCQGRFSIGE